MDQADKLRQMAEEIDGPGWDWLQSPGAESRCRVYARDGRFLSIMRLDAEKKQWRPEKVFAVVSTTTG